MPSSLRFIQLVLTLVTGITAVAANGGERTVDVADHECRIVLDKISGIAGWNPPPFSGVVVNLRVRGDIFQNDAGQSAFLLARWTGRPWQTIEVAEDWRRSGFVYFSATVFPPADIGIDPQLDVIAALETPTRRLFDHNWHTGDFGHITLNRSTTGWDVGNLSPGCL